MVHLNRKVAVNFTIVIEEAININIGDKLSFSFLRMLSITPKPIINYYRFGCAEL